MDRRTKASLNRDKATRLQAQWGIDARQVRYSDDGHWYATLTRFPAALLDARGYLRFATEQDYRRAPISIGKQISVRKPGISVVPGYVQVRAAEPPVVVDVDIHSVAVNEGQRQLVQHLQRERKRTIVRMKKARAASFDCEVCGFSFGRAYGTCATDYCEVHHLVPLSQADDETKTRIEDLAIVCANCHRVIHLRNPPYEMNDVRRMLGK
jgi:5-methylcytosine-specific restriction endonuclease McrA